MAATGMADLPRPAIMRILSFAILAAILYERPDGCKLFTTIAHRRDSHLARTTPLPPTNRSESMHRTDAETPTDRIVPGPDEAHRSATDPDPSNPDPSNLKHKTSITNAHKLSSDPSADGAPDADCHRMAPGDGPKIAAPAPPAAPTSPVPIQSTTTSKTTSAPPPCPQAAPLHRRQPLPRPPRTSPLRHHAVTDSTAPRSGEHSTDHSLSHGAVATATAHSARRPPLPQSEAARSARLTRTTMDSALAHRSDRASGRDPGPPALPAQALPPTDTADLPLHTVTNDPANQRRTAPPRTSPRGATAALWPRLRRLPPPPCAHPTRHRGTHSPITQRGDDHSVHRAMPAGTVATTMPPHGCEPLRDNAERSKRARTSAPLAGYDGRAP